MKRLTEAEFKSGLLFEEKLPKYIIGTTEGSKYEHKFDRWLYRSIAAVAIFLILLLMPYGFRPYSILVLMIVLATCMLYASEVQGNKFSRSAKPIRIFADRIEVYASLYQRLKGFNGAILVKDVDWVHVERRDAYQLVKRNDMVRLRWAPLELRIKLNDGTEYLTGLKSPAEILAMAQVLKEKLNISVVDTGEGLGRVEPYMY
ncbi:hypothetical protein [Methanomassiliicoccus luminyensis]|uniref:hypothetical protein n=1 Tax=Methanomassiliicoccus luminyensis TaxID=1080712 RepID=UPI0011C96557|nr:hypothetical protein [Methanomassiliicoccus luminyensis]